jgi:hypothetical protein
MIYLIILNWNGWKDTIACLQSILAIKQPFMRIILCDNNSDDGSISYLKNWLSQLPTETFALSQSADPEIKICKKYSYQRVDFIKEPQATPDADHRICLIQTGKNRGYGGGNNIAISFAMRDPTAAAVWILNNDTAVDQNALMHLQNYVNNHPRCGLVGSKILLFDKPETIQAIGGSYSPHLGLSKHIGAYEKDQGQYDTPRSLSLIDYPIGASLYATRAYIESVGLLNEDYFLYFEELDWVLRGKNNGWEWGFCWQSRVFHKEGQSTGSQSSSGAKSLVADYYNLINRVRFTRNFYPQYVWSVKCGLLLAGIKRIWRGQFTHLALIYKALRM